MNLLPLVKIGSRFVGPGQTPLLVAEIGINHNGSLADAKRLVDAAWKAGADAVKFQKRSLEDIYTSSVLNDLDSHEQGFQYLIPILQETELSENEINEVKVYAEEKGLLFLCTPFDVRSAEYLGSLDLEAFKISSADLTNMPLIETAAQFQKPLILSTGMSVEHEVSRTVEFLRERSVPFLLLHCVSSYPVDPQNADLERIKHLAARYRCPVGYSGHDLGTSLSLVAVTFGACLIEKHFTFDRSLSGPDHKVSLLPEELQRLAARLRDEKTNGFSLEVRSFKERKIVLQGEELNKQLFRKGVVAAEPIQKGEVITEEMLTLRCPGGGLTGQDLGRVIGMRARRCFRKEEPFYPSDLRVSDGVSDLLKPSWGRWGLVVRYHDFENALQHDPSNLEFHLTYRDTQLPVPLRTFEKHRESLRNVSLRVHCCEYVGEKLFDLCSEYAATREYSLKTLQRVIDITAELAPFFSSEQPKIVFNCGAMTLREEVRSLQVNEERFYELLRQLDTKGTLLLAQTMPPYPWYFGGQWKGHYFLAPEELARFCEALNGGVCLDLSHSHMAAQFLNIPFDRYLEQIAPYVHHIHVNDALSMEGEGVQVNEGRIDFDLVFNIFPSFQGTWVPEIWQGHLNNNAGAREATRRFSELYTVWTEKREQKQAAS